MRFYYAVLLMNTTIDDSTNHRKFWQKTDIELKLNNVTTKNKKTFNFQLIKKIWQRSALASINRVDDETTVVVVIAEKFSHYYC